MPTVGEQLKQARLARNLTTQQMAEVTKIRTDHIRALEEGRYEVFAAAVYVRGFVRCCASFLKLDVPQVMAALEAELARCPKFQEAVLGPATGPSPLVAAVRWLTKLNWKRTVVWLGVTVLVSMFFVGLLLWHQNRSAGTVKDFKAGIYRPGQQTGDTLPLPAGAPRQ